MIAITFMLLANYRDFEDRINYQTALVAKQAELQILSDINFRNSNIDTLTGLPNRRHFFSELDQRIRSAASSGANFGIGILDLDGFKPVNDVHGHPTGDRVLIEAGQRRREQLGASVFLARIGGGIRDVAKSTPAIGISLQSVKRSRSSCKRRSKSGTAAQIGGSIGLPSFPPLRRTRRRCSSARTTRYFINNTTAAIVIFRSSHEAEIREASAVAQA